MIAPCAHSRVLETTRNWVVKRIQGRGIVNSFHRELFNLFVGVDGEVDPGNARGDWTSEIRHCVLQLRERQKTLAVRSRRPRRKISKFYRCGRAKLWSNFFFCPTPPPRMTIRDDRVDHYYRFASHTHSSFLSHLSLGGCVSASLAPWPI